MSEIELLQRASAGDSAAWETLIGEHQQAVFRLAYLLLRDRHEAEDIAQEAFVRAFLALHTFDRARPLRPWLLAIAANLARNRRRSLGRYLAALRRLISAEPPPVAAFEDRTGAQWEAQTLWQALAKLRDSDQQVIYLRYFLELSEAEMIAALGIAPGTVKSRLHRAMERLRAVVDSEFPALREGRRS